MQRAAPVQATAPRDALARTVAERVTGVQAEWLGGAVPWFRRLIEAAESPNVTDAEFTALVERAARNVPDELAPLLRPAALAEALEHAMGAAVTSDSAYPPIRHLARGLKDSGIIHLTANHGEATFDAFLSGIGCCSWNLRISHPVYMANSPATRAT
jgi:hypothetical protein